ncbi:MAG: nucleoside deaminase [Gemmataceae bacterium]
MAKPRRRLAEFGEALPAEAMTRALEQAEAAFAADEVPVGAVVWHAERGFIATGRNRREERQDPTAHAEILALTMAAAELGSWRLEDCLLAVTLEPCPMCAGAIVQARVPWVVFGAVDRKAGACETLFQLLSDERLNHRAEVQGGILAAECGAILTRFFAQKRALGKK